jgi:HlyD family secretion protein
MSRHRASRETRSTLETGPARSVRSLLPTVSAVSTPRRRRLITAAVPIVLVASSVVACATSLPPAPKTVKVVRTSVTSGVSAAGSLAALDEENLGFATPGQLTSVKVKVGDRVDAGQVLATIDDYAAQQALKQAQAQLAAQQAALAGVTANPAVGNSQASLNQARTIVDRTQNQADATLSADETAIDNAHRALSAAQHALNQAEDARDAACSTTGSGGGSGSGGSGSGGSGSGGYGGWGHGNSSMLSTVTSAANTAAGTATPTTGPGTQACSTAQAAVTQAKQTVVADQNAVDAAEQKLNVDRAAGQLAVANAQQGVVTAQNGLNSASAARPSSIDQSNAAVANAAAAVANAQRNVDNTTLRAPVAGTVSVLNGSVGEYVGASTGTSAVAPGSSATIPGASGASATGAGAGGSAAAQAASPTRPGGTQFLVLDNINQFQVVLPFSESDAAQINANQPVKVTFDAVPDLTANGSVLAVSPAGTAISGVISYYVTASLPQSDPRLKAGMTAHGEVVTQSTNDVLAVPTNAVHKQNGAPAVTVVGADGTQREVTVTTGAVGDGLTQIVSGVQEGDNVVVPPTS